jgi:hypothetical protein
MSGQAYRTRSEGPDGCTASVVVFCIGAALLITLVVAAGIALGWW